MALPQGLYVAVDLLGVVLLHFLWQGMVAGVVYAALKPFCIGAAARYRLGLCALAALALAPLLTAYMCWPGETSVASSSATIFADTLQVGAQALATSPLKPVLPWLVCAWLCGVLAIAARSLWQWRRLMYLVRSAAAAPAEWQTRLQCLCERFQLRRPVRLLCSVSAVTPMLLGWIKPVILLPTSMLSGFTPAQVEMIIAHELGHIRRFDYVVNLLQVAIETILFYHPVVHWISRDVRNAREACCDDIALQVAGGSRLVYARALAELEELRLMPALGAGGGVLLTRIKRIVGESEHAEPLPRSYVLPVLLVCAAFIGLSLRPQAAPELRAALDRIPAQALALLSRTSFRVERPGLSLNLPRPEVQPVRVKAVLQTPPAAVPRENHLTAEPAPPPAAAIADPPAVPLATTTPSLATPPVTPVPVAPVLDPPKSPPLHVVAPAYPVDARAAGIEGAVTLEYGIKGDGTIGQIRVVSARPAGVFEEVAKAALRGWSYPVSSAGEKRVQNFAFTLRGQNRPEEQCETPTGSLICRKPGA